MMSRRHSRSLQLAVTLGALLLEPQVHAAEPTAQACAPGRPVTLFIELGSGTNAGADLYAVPEGKVLIVTDVIALREGNADGLLELLEGKRVVGVLPLVGIVSHTDLYGVHLVTGIPFHSGQVVRVEKQERGTAWVTLMGYEANSL